MLDPALAFLTWMVATAGVTALVPAGQIVVGDLPQGADPGAGETWVTFRVRGGNAHEEIDGLIDADFELTVWSDSGPKARAACGAIFDAVHGKNNIDLGTAGVVLKAMEHIQPQDFTEPLSGWPTIVWHFGMTLRAAA